MYLSGALEYLQHKVTGLFQQKISVLKGYLVDHRITGKARKLDSENRAVPREAGQNADQTTFRNDATPTKLDCPLFLVQSLVPEYLVAEALSQAAS